MTYRLTRRTRVSRQLRHNLREQVTEALDHLASPTPSEDAIHQARKCVKRARAILHLLKEDLGSSFRRENDRLRAAAHSLSALRDADVNGETLHQLQRRHPSVLTAATVRAFARGLQARKRRTRAGAGALLGSARKALEQSRESAPGRVARAANRGAVRRGMMRGYRQARRAFEQIVPDSGASSFHLWRRRVKDHGYHVQLCEGLSSGARVRARLLKQLETLLGDEHNLTLLRNTILAPADSYGDARATALVLGCITRNQASLRSRALELGARLFSEAPAHFDRVVRGWWRPV